jgi:hypothetical protein
MAEVDPGQEQQQFIDDFRVDGLEDLIDAKGSTTRERRSWTAVLQTQVHTVAGVEQSGVFFVIRPDLFGHFRFQHGLCLRYVLSGPIQELDEPRNIRRQGFGAGPAGCPIILHDLHGFGGMRGVHS